MELVSRRTNIPITIYNIGIYYVNGNSFCATCLDCLEQKKKFSPDNYIHTYTFTILGTIILLKRQYYTS